MRLLHALGVGALLGYLAYDPKPTLVFVSHGIVLFLAVAGLPILRHLANRSASGRDRFLAVWYATSIVGGLVTSWTSYNALFNFPIGAFGAIPAILLDWFRFEPGAIRTPRIPVLSAVAVLLALGVGSVAYSYGEIPGSKLDARIHGGPFAGLRTTSERAKLFDSLRERLRDSGSSAESTTVLGIAPGLYLFTPMKVRTPLSWPLSDGLDALTPILERHYADPANRPETIVWYAPPQGIHPVQQEMLAAEYVLQSRDDAVCIFRRRDVARPGEHPVLIQWGKGFWPEERDGTGFWRWALSEGRLDIQQYSGKPKACRIRAQFYSYYPEPAGMTVTGPDFRRDFEIDSSPRTLDLTLTLPPGNSTIRWNCNAVPYVHPSRNLVFAVRDYSVEIADADGP